jgi:ABC-type Zn uptake system ZnuABC Zn-binding protein ZnuA
MGDVHPQGNPHYWTDPENGRRMARAIAGRLSQLDAKNAALYQKDLAAFEAKLTEKEREWAAKMAPFRGAEIVTFHDSWPNFAKAFDLVVAGQIEPKPGIPPSPAHTLEVVNLIQREKIKVILVEPYFDTKTPKFIADKTGATMVVGYPSVGGIPEIKDYFSLFDVNLAALAAALGGKP